MALAVLGHAAERQPFEQTGKRALLLLPIRSAAAAERATLCGMGAQAELEINGSPPDLASQCCEELICEQYWYQGILAEPANVIHLRFAAKWHRLCFDYGTIFWRTQSERPAPYTMPEFEAETKLDDLGARLGLVGRVLHTYESRAILRGSEVEFRFEGGTKVVFRDVDDHTAIICEEHAPSER